MMRRQRRIASARTHSGLRSGDEQFICRCRGERYVRLEAKEPACRILLQPSWGAEV